MEPRHHVHAKGAIDALSVELVERLDGLPFECRIVQQDVDASERLHHLVDDAGALLRAREIAS